MPVKSDKIILMNDMKVPEAEEGSTVTQQNSEINRSESKSSKTAGSDDVGFFSMSLLQKCFFIFSILLSVLYVVVFAWVIPCKNPQSENSNAGSIHVTKEWEVNLSGLSITSNLEALRRKELNEHIEIFGYSNSTVEHGMMALRSRDGAVFWQKLTLFPPKYCKCDSLDANSDGITDCIIVGENGFISVINATDGEPIWHSQQNYELSSHDFATPPAVIPDCNNDGISELLVAHSFFNSTGSKDNFRVSMVIFSGGNGAVHARIDIHQCSLPIDKLQLWKRTKKETDILFYCINGEGFGNLWSVSSEKLRNLPSERLNQNSIDLEEILKIEQPKRKSSKMHYLEIEKANVNGRDILVAWNDAEIALLSGETKEEKWTSSINDHGDIKAMLFGQFSQMENVAVLISSSQTSGTTVTSLHVGNGSVITNTTYDNYFTTSALLLPEILSQTDGILLKHINMSINPFEDPVSENPEKNPSIKRFQFEEEYLLIQCIRRKVLQSISKTEVTRLCTQNQNCLDRIYSDSPTAFVSDINAENSHKLILATTTSMEANNDQTVPPEESTVVKLFTLNGSPFYNNTETTC